MGENFRALFLSIVIKIMRSCNRANSNLKDNSQLMERNDLNIVVCL